MPLARQRAAFTRQMPLLILDAGMAFSLSICYTPPLAPPHAARRHDISARYAASAASLSSPFTLMLRWRHAMIFHC